MSLYYVIAATLAENLRGEKIFSPLQEDIIFFSLFSPDKEEKIFKESKLSLDEYTKLKEKTFKKLESVIFKLVVEDLRSNVFSPELAQKRLEQFWKSKDFPLKENIKDIFIEQEVAPDKEFQRAKKIQRLASRHNKPWIYLKRTKYPKKTKKLKGVYKNADEGMKELIAKIDEEELNKQKIISITCEEKLARYLLEKLSELLREKVKEDIL